MTFQVPVYATIIASSGASGRGLLFGIVGAIAIMVALGHSYGAFLGWVRALFGLSRKGLKPISLNDWP